MALLLEECSELSDVTLLSLYLCFEHHNALLLIRWDVAHFRSGCVLLTESLENDGEFVDFRYFTSQVLDALAERFVFSQETSSEGEARVFNSVDVTR